MVLDKTYIQIYYVQSIFDPKALAILFYSIFSIILKGLNTYWLGTIVVLSLIQSMLPPHSFLQSTLLSPSWCDTVLIGPTTKH